MSMVIKRNHLGQAEICGSGEFVGEFVQGAFVGVAPRRGAGKLSPDKILRVRQLMAVGLSKAAAIAQVKAGR